MHPINAEKSHHLYFNNTWYIAAVMGVHGKVKFKYKILHVYTSDSAVSVCT